MIVHEGHTNNDRHVFTGMHIYFPSFPDPGIVASYLASGPIRGDPFDVVWRQFISEYRTAASDAQSHSNSGGTCSTEHYTDSGTVDKSGGYSNGLSCQWTLTCGSNSMMHPTLSFSSFSTESNFDWVNVFDGEVDSSTRLLHTSGSEVPDTVVGSGTEMSVQFVTDSSVMNDGFSATFSCEDEIEIEGSWIDVEPFCLGGPSVGSVWVANVDDTNAEWESCTEHVTGVTSSLIFSAGAQYTVAEISGQCFRTSQYSHLWAPLSAGTYTCGGQAGQTADPCNVPFASLTDGGMVDKCGGYSNGLSCQWTLTCSNSMMHPTLSFSSFSTESNFDWVNVFDGEVDSSTRLLHTSGSEVPDTVVGSGTEMSVQFVTDSSVMNDGFSATFSCTDRHPTTRLEAAGQTKGFSSGFVLTDQTFNDDENGNVLISASCPSTTVDATVYGGVLVDLTLLPVDVIFELDTEHGKTVLVDTSAVGTCIMWTGSYPAELTHAGEGRSHVEGTWDGLSQTLSDGGEQYFVFARHTGTSTSSTGAATLLLQFDVMYYKPELDVSIDGSDGRLATLQASYTYSEVNGYQLVRQSLSTKMSEDKNELVSEEIPLKAGGTIVPIMLGSVQDPKTGLPVGQPRTFLFQPSVRALRWGIGLQLGRKPVTQDLRDTSAREVLMLEVTGIAGRTNTFAGLFDEGVLTATTSEQTGQVQVDPASTGSQGCVHLLQRPGNCVKFATSKVVGKIHDMVKVNPHYTGIFITVMALLVICGCCQMRMKIYRSSTKKLGFAEGSPIEYSPVGSTVATEHNPILSTTDHEPSRDSAFKASV